VILRRHATGATESEALYSECEAYRYRLSRTWGEGARLACVMLNPSTATEVRNDPTIARCEGRARRAGFGGVDILNLFAFRATRPADLRKADDPVGEGNEVELLRTVERAGVILCGWGVHGGFLGAGDRMRSLLRARGLPLCHLGLTRHGQPRHPLYVGTAVDFQRWD
jgi:hypothetical protein